MTRTGIGYDIHPFAIGRPLVLGGITIPHPENKGLTGHSDADVLSHAIADALLGAAGKRDIGYYFPNNDASLKNISSLLILKKAAELIRLDHGKIINIDATVIAEEPKIAPYVESMRATLADALEIPLSSVGLKATTNEGLGALGRGEGIAALATASVAYEDDERKF
ncbi:MAG: 2-C-methyl-D-erythritol 2,4-cyclodiphosphate synthase [Chthoniobacterales bacterium]